MQMSSPSPTKADGSSNNTSNTLETLAEIRKRTGVTYGRSKPKDPSPIPNDSSSTNNNLHSSSHSQHQDASQSDLPSSSPSNQRNPFDSSSPIQPDIHSPNIHRRVDTGKHGHNGADGNGNGNGQDENDEVSNTKKSNESNWLSATETNPTTAEEEEEDKNGNDNSAPPSSSPFKFGLAKAIGEDSDSEDEGQGQGLGGNSDSKKNKAGGGGIRSASFSSNDKSNNKNLEPRSSPSDPFSGSLTSLDNTTSLHSENTFSSDRPIGPGSSRRFTYNNSSDSNESSDLEIGTKKSKKRKEGPDSDEDEDEDLSEDEDEEESRPAFASRMKSKSNQKGSSSSKSDKTKGGYKSIASKIMDSDSDLEESNPDDSTKTLKPNVKGKGERLEELRARKLKELKEKEIQESQRNGGGGRGLKSSSPIDDILNQDEVSDSENELLGAFELAQKTTKDLQRKREEKEKLEREEMRKQIDEEDRLTGSDLDTDSDSGKKRKEKAKGKGQEVNGSRGKSRKQGGKRERSKKEKVKKPKSLSKAELEKMQAGIARLDRNSKKSFRDLKAQELEMDDEDDEDEEVYDDTARFASGSINAPKHSITSLVGRFAKEPSTQVNQNTSDVEDEEEEDEIKDFNDSSSDLAASFFQTKPSRSSKKLSNQINNSSSSSSYSRLNESNTSKLSVPSSSTSRVLGNRDFDDDDFLVQDSFTSNSKKLKVPTQSSQILPASSTTSHKLMVPTQIGQWSDGQPKIGFSSSSSGKPKTSKASSEALKSDDIDDEDDDLDFLSLDQMIEKKKEEEKKKEGEKQKKLELELKKENLRKKKLEWMEAEERKKNKTITAAQLIERELNKDQEQEEDDDDLLIVQDINPKKPAKVDSLSRSAMMQARTVNLGSPANRMMKDMKSTSKESIESQNESQDLWTESQFVDSARYGHGTRLGASGGGVKSRVKRETDGDSGMDNPARRLNFGEDQDEDEIVTSTALSTVSKPGSSSKPKTKNQVGKLTQQNMNSYLARQAEKQRILLREQKAREAGIKKKAKIEAASQIVKAEDQEEPEAADLATQLKRFKERAAASHDQMAVNDDDDDDGEDGDFNEDDEILRGSGSEPEVENEEEENHVNEDETVKMDLDLNEEAQDDLGSDEEGKVNAPPSSQDPAPFRTSLPSTAFNDEEDEDDDDDDSAGPLPGQRKARRRLNQVLSDDEEEEEEEKDQENQENLPYGIGADGRRDSSPTPHLQNNGVLPSLNRTTTSQSTRNILQDLSPEEIRTRSSTQPQESDGNHDQQDDLDDYPQDAGPESPSPSLGNWFNPTNNPGQPVASIRRTGGVEKSDSEVMGQFFQPTQNESGSESLDILGHLGRSHSTQVVGGIGGFTQLFEEGTPMEGGPASTSTDGFAALRQAQEDVGLAPAASLLPNPNISAAEEEEDEAAHNRQDALARQQRLAAVNQTPKAYLGRDGFFTQTKPTTLFDSQSQSQSQSQTPLWRKNQSSEIRRDSLEEPLEAGPFSPSQPRPLKRFRRGGKEMDDANNDDEDEEEERGGKDQLSSPSLQKDQASEQAQKQPSNIFEKMMQQAKDQPIIDNEEERKKMKRRFLQDQADESDEEDEENSKNKRSKLQGGLAGIFDENDESTDKKEGDEDEDAEDDGKDLEGLVDDEKDEDEKIKDALVREQHRLDEEARDQQELARVTKITEGKMRLKKARENGGGLDEMLEEDYDDEDLRRRANGFPTHKKRKVKGGDGLDGLAQNEESRAFVSTYQATLARDQDKEYDFLNGEEQSDSDSDSDEDMDDEEPSKVLSKQEIEAKHRERVKKRKRNEIVSDDEKEEEQDEEENQDQQRFKNEWDSDSDEEDPLTRGFLADRRKKRAVTGQHGNVGKSSGAVNFNPKALVSDDEEEDVTHRLVVAGSKAPRSAKEKAKLEAYAGKRQEEDPSSRVKMSNGGGSISSFTGASRGRNSNSSTSSHQASPKNSNNSEKPKKGRTSKLHNILGSRESQFVESQ